MDKGLLLIIIALIAFFYIKKPFFASPQDTELIARTIFSEAAGESPEGRIAVANVIHNRYLSKRKGEYGYTYREIIFKPNQFQSVGEPLWNKLDAPGLMTEEEKSIYNECLEIAKNVLKGTTKDNTLGALLYYNPQLATPQWDWSLLEWTVTIGNHKFYKYKENKLGGVESGRLQNQYRTKKSGQRISYGFGFVSDSPNTSIDGAFGRVPS